MRSLMAVLRPKAPDAGALYDSVVAEARRPAWYQAPLISRVVPTSPNTSKRAKLAASRPAKSVLIISMSSWQKIRCSPRERARPRLYPSHRDRASLMRINSYACPARACASVSFTPSKRRSSMLQMMIEYMAGCRAGESGPAGLSDRLNGLLFYSREIQHRELQ